MCFLFSFIPATFWAAVGYFVLFSSIKTESVMRRFGQVLAVWIFIVALFFPICGAYMTLSGICPIDQAMKLMGKANDAASYAEEAQLAIAAIWATAKVYHAENGVWPTNIIQLEKLRLEPQTRERWQFSLVIEDNRIKVIKASSTFRMPGGTGKVVTFDIQRGIWAGYGFDYY